MANADPPAKRPPSLAYALGQLTERIDSVKENQKGLKEDIHEIRDAILPRLTALEVRATGVEHKQLLWTGGGIVVIAIVGVLVGHPIH